jgi:hypothetical protein
MKVDFEEKIKFQKNISKSGVSIKPCRHGLRHNYIDYIVLTHISKHHKCLDFLIY